MKNNLLKRLSSAFFLQNLLAKLMAFIPPMVDHNLGKYAALKKAFYLIWLEGLEGDYIEFGVFTGSSFQAAIEFSKRSTTTRPIRFFGFDSFRGFGTLSDKDQHPFYKDLNFETSKSRVENRLHKLLKDSSRVQLIDGFFEETLKDKRPAHYGIGKAVVIMVDCDTLAASELAFSFIAPVLQAGTLIVIDDFFSYKGSVEHGTCGAFNNFQKHHPEWTFRRVFDYGCGGAVFIAAGGAKTEQNEG